MMYCTDFSLKSQEQIQYVPLPHPEDVKRMVEEAYLAGARDGFFAAAEKFVLEEEGS